jgi:hypothetical protein
MSSPSTETVRLIREYLVSRFAGHIDARVLASDVVKRTDVASADVLSGLGQLVEDGLLQPGIEARCELTGHVSNTAIERNGDTTTCVQCGDVPHRRLVFYSATPAMRHLVESAHDPKRIRSAAKAVGRRFKLKGRTRLAIGSRRSQESTT